MSWDQAMAAHPAGKGIPESPEVAEARMDLEACEVGSSNWRPSRSSGWDVAGIIAAFTVVSLAQPLVDALVRGWPL